MTGCSLIVFPVSNLKSATKLYRTLLGTDPYVEQDYYVGFRLGELEVGLDPQGHQRGSTGALAYSRTFMPATHWSSEREPWLAIDPKPYVGDPAYDVLQRMLNCQERLRTDPRALAARMSDLAGLENERVILWLFRSLRTGVAGLAGARRCRAPHRTGVAEA